MRSKKMTIFLIILLILVVLLLTGIMFLLLKGNFRFFYSNNTSSNLSIEEMHENKYEEIIIKNYAGEIEVRQTNEYNIKVIIYSENDNATVKEFDNKLEIETQNKKCNFLCINHKIDKIELYLPYSYDKKLYITSNYGDVTIESFEKIDLKIALDAGDLKIDTINLGNIKLSYGDLELKKASELNIKMDAGDIEIGEVNNIEVKNNYGDINIDKINNYFNIKEDCGDVKINSVNIEKDSFIENSLGDIKINTTNKIYIDAKTSLGEVKINNNYKDSDITLKIDNSCGDIVVKN